MSDIVLNGVNGSNPLGFLASLGLLRLASTRDPRARLRFVDDGTYRAALAAELDVSLAELVVADAREPLPERPWYLSYEKTEKNGTKVVGDLKAPPDQFKAYLKRALDAWTRGEDEPAAYAAAFGTSVAVDGKGNTKPTALHFTAANQKFLESIDELRRHIDAPWVEESLMRGHAMRPGGNVRWDPASERNWALMAENPNTDGTRVDAPLEWLAFRGMVLLPTFPQQPPPSFRDAVPRVITTAIFGRGDDMHLSWPLWAVPASLGSVRSLLQLDWDESGPTAAKRRAEMSVFSVCSSTILRSTQGYGNFAPASIHD